MRDGPRGFGQGSSCPALLRVPPATARHTRTGLSPPMAPLSSGFRFACRRRVAALQPRARRNGPGLGWSPFARRYSGNRCCFLLLRVLRCFSSPGLPPPCGGYPAFSWVGCPIRTPADRWVCAPPRGFSQLVASFVASESLGIPRAPLITSRALARPVFARFLLLLRNILFLLVVYKKMCYFTPPPRQRTLACAPYGAGAAESYGVEPSSAQFAHGRTSPLAEILFLVNLSLVWLGSLPQYSWRITDSNR